MTEKKKKEAELNGNDHRNAQRQLSNTKPQKPGHLRMKAFKGKASRFLLIISFAVFDLNCFGPSNRRIGVAKILQRAD